MDRSKIVAIVAGAISITLALAYLLLVQLLDFRREMIPAPVSIVPQAVLAQIPVDLVVEISSTPSLQPEGNV
ncbi:glucose-inhibited division protein A [Cyanobacteria bacterium FACHB-472]|nr:glucose-inhibited division protein A [Cyanobacteria bacterium FACHB-472]